MAAVDFFKPVDRRNARMIQERQYTGFPLESSNALGIVAERFRKKLNCDTTAELYVGSLVTSPYSARPNVTSDLVMCEFCSDHVLPRGAPSTDAV
jgi:hypothetical protein